ncbi:MAG TPA: M28 family peptidase [Salinivirga sp.]|uniref:M28 family metallopeptidase n=1 Tax=Salinivirga sp. TaxID=1970192 RepID=UPI002B48DA4D|nr:M28 family peptidase [Salinivirga sp.]HKK58388.1 M28 family peptidase [Salinivirga sp.]
MTLLKSVLLLALLFTISLTPAQDKSFATKIIDRLASEAFDGRGYVNNGDIKAARYIASEFKNSGALPLGKSYLHPFNISINTFPDTVSVKVDKKNLKTAKDFMVGGGSKETNGTYELVYIDTTELNNLADINQDINDKVVVLPAAAEKDKRTYKLNAAGYIFTHKNNLYWRLSDAVEVKPYFYLHTYDSLINDSKTINANINNTFYENYRTANVMAMIEGSAKPDSFYVFTAHYDHLGRMGSEVFFPGANDNASGTAMLLDMARHYSKPMNKPEYSMIFMAFAAEECGLFGSEYAANNSPVALDKIKFLFNLDMVGSGSGGIGMVNAKVEPKADSLINAINDEKNYFSDIRSGGARCVSDHCAFARKNVPAIFIFTRGKEYMHYHTISDSGPVPLTKWDELFNLLNNFMRLY